MLFFSTISKMSLYLDIIIFPSSSLYFFPLIFPIRCSKSSMADSYWNVVKKGVSLSHYSPHHLVLIGLIFSVWIPSFSQHFGKWVHWFMPGCFSILHDKAYTLALNYFECRFIYISCTVPSIVPTCGHVPITFSFLLSLWINWIWFN